MQLKIAFYMMGGEDWTFGPIYLRTLFYALRQRCEKELGLSLLVPATQDDAYEYARSFEADEVILYSIPQRWTPLWAINGLIKRLLSCDIVVESLPREQRINVVFGSMLMKLYNKEKKLKPEITNKYRARDVRYCFADISKIKINRHIDQN